MLGSARYPRRGAGMTDLFGAGVAELLARVWRTLGAGVADRCDGGVGEALGWGVMDAI